MKNKLAVAFIVLSVLVTGCGKAEKIEEPMEADSEMTLDNVKTADVEENVSTESVADYPAAMMADGKIYLLEEKPMPGEVDDSAIIGYTESYTDAFPENNGETNFNRELGMPYAKVEDGIAVFINNEWYLCTPAASDPNENTITFLGTISDHTVESSETIICVKPLKESEEQIPYDAVFFELTEEDANWALQIGSVVEITCAGTFTEEAPHYGTLIAIESLEIEIDIAENLFTAEEIEAAKQIALDYYEDTVFTVNSIEYFNGDLPYGGGEDCCNFTVNVSKGGVVQEPDRTISLQLNNGVWEVVNEGY